MDNYIEKLKNDNGNVFYYDDENGDFHRLDGPAYENNNGNKEWYIHGRLHRIDAAAVERSNGYKEWHLYNKFVDEYTHKIHSDSLFGILLD